MKFYFLTAVALVSLTFLNSCKKDVPGYCTENYFGEIQLTDVLGNPTTTFALGDDIVMNMPFSNTYGDSIKLNYSEPWIVYEVYNGAQLVLTTADLYAGNTGMTSAYLGPGDIIDGTYTLTTNLMQGNYTLKAICYYQYTNCFGGLLIEEKSVDFNVTI